MSTPLTDSINALTTYANEVTGASDTNLSDAVHTLASGYGGGSATLITKTITANGTYSAEDDNADGYSSVTVNVPTGGGASSWTKVAETTYQVSTTNTTTSIVATWETGHSELWTSDKFVYVRIRDTAGKREGYFYGSDQFFMNHIPINGSTRIDTSVSGRFYTSYANEVFETGYHSGTSGYGLYADTLYNDGRIRVRVKYSSTHSRTIDGTYKVEVYLLGPAGGVPIFE